MSGAHAPRVVAQPALRLAVGALVARAGPVRVEDIARAFEADWLGAVGNGGAIIDRAILARALRASRLVLIDSDGVLARGPAFAEVAPGDRDRMALEFEQAAREGGA